MAFDAKIATPPSVSGSPGARLFELEERLGLLRHRLDGWCVWPLFRFRAGYALSGDSRPPNGGRVHSYRRRTLAKIAARDCWRLLSGHHRAEGPVVVTNSSYRTELDEQGRPKDVLFDDYCVRLPGVIKIERINNPALYELETASAYPSLLTDAALQLFGGIALTRLPVPRAIQAVARELVDDLHTQPEWRCYNLENVGYALVHFRRLRLLWKATFQRLGRSVLLMDDGYFHQDMIAAAKECRMQVVDLQHGAFFEDGPEYVWPNHAAAWRSTMPVPDQVWLFGNHWREMLSRQRFWAGRCQVVGSTRVDQYRDLCKQARRGAGGRECYLIITTQGVGTAALIEWVRGILVAAHDWPELRVVLKLHPAKEGGCDPYSKKLAADSRLQVCSGNELPSTFQWLTRADYHASVSSACHYEAVALGVPSFVLPMPTHEWMLPMVHAGHAILPDSPSEMVRRMRQLQGQRIGEETGCHYYQPGATENFANALCELERASARSSCGRTSSPV